MSEQTPPQTLSFQTQHTLPFSLDENGRCADLVKLEAPPRVGVACDIVLLLRFGFRSVTSKLVLFHAFMVATPIHDIEKQRLSDRIPFKPQFPTAKALDQTASVSPGVGVGGSEDRRSVLGSETRQCLTECRKTSFKRSIRSVFSTVSSTQATVPHIRFDHEKRPNKQLRVKEKHEIRNKCQHLGTCRFKASSRTWASIRAPSLPFRSKAVSRWDRR